MNGSNNNQGEGGSKKKRRRKRSPIAIFFRTVFLIVFVFLLVSCGGLYAYYRITTPNQPEGGDGSNGTGTTAKNPGFIDTILGKEQPIQVNAAVFGVDGNGTRTDVIFVVHFDSKTNRISLMSIPRDTRVTMVQEIQDKLREAGRYMPGGGVCKINEVHAYSGTEHGPEYAVLQLEDLLGIKIDYYAKVNLDGFKEIVDKIGGVEMDVPQNMYYSDPYQNLYINLKAGPQTLDGDKAEQLVRFRSYKQGDVARVEVQQMFLKAFAKKVLNTDTIINNLVDYISFAFNYLDTNFTLGDALKYVKYVKDIDVNNIAMETLPGEGRYVGEVSYYIHDEEATKEAVQRIFFGQEDGEEAVSDETTGDSKGLNIEVANGGIIQGLAAKKQDMLESMGYTVPEISTYDGERTSNTRIIVREKGVGNDLKQYFTNALIQVDASKLDSNIDIKIILGTDEE